MPGIKSIKNTRNIDTYDRIDAPLQGSSGSTVTVFIRWPYILHTFDRVLRTIAQPPRLGLTLAQIDSPNIANKTALLAFPNESRFYSG
jgi:hypothetical protein